MVLYDSFNNGTYYLSDNPTLQYTPNGLWVTQFAGVGTLGTEDYGDPGLFQQPKTSTSPGETHACLLRSTFAFNNATFSVDMKTLSQLRQGSAPNPWETAWFMWNWTDNTHQYSATLKTSGFQIEKVDGGGEIFIATPATPKVNIGQWQNLQITFTNSQTSTPHITAVVDGVTVVDLDDTGTPNDAALQKGGFIGLYNEDARVKFRNMNVTRI